jgi:hypothetical protein
MANSKKPYKPILEEHIVSDEFHDLELNRWINDLYGDLAPDEIDILLRNYEGSMTTMVEVVALTERTLTFRDLYEDTEFTPVVMPQVLGHYLKLGDVFLTSLGLKNRRWHIVYLSPSYITETIELDDEEDLDGDKYNPEKQGPRPVSGAYNKRLLH